MTPEQEAFGEQYAYRDIQEYATILGITLSDSHRIVWDMARTKNKHLGIFEADKPETELP